MADHSSYSQLLKISNPSQTVLPFPPGRISTRSFIICDEDALDAAQPASFELCTERLAEQQLKVIGPILLFSLFFCKGPPPAILNLFPGSLSSTPGF